LKSFETVREYLCSLDSCIEAVDPILSNNKGLVEVLAAFEESWEVAAVLIADASMRSSLDGVCSTLQRVGELEPAFQQMCSDCDVELFLIIPRVVVFAFLNCPTESALIKMLLPHPFEDRASRNKLQTLRMHFEDLVLESPECEDMLMRKLVHGPGAEETSAFISEEYQGRTELFMKELEPWSIELQRRHAVDWNAFCSVVARFLSSDCKQELQITP
jgi:hypothetical protein